MTEPDTLDLMTFRSKIEDRLEKFSNKAERQAFLTGVCMGARLMGFDERQRVCQDLMSLWGLEMGGGGNKPKKPAKRIAQIKAANVGKVDDALLDQLSDFLA